MRNGLPTFVVIRDTDDLAYGEKELLLSRVPFKDHLAFFKHGSTEIAYHTGNLTHDEALSTFLSMFAK
jgi:hypothetical protein